MKLLTVLALLLFSTGCDQHQSSHAQEKHVSDSLNVAICSDYQPFAYKQEKELTGFDVLLIKNIAQQMGKKIVFHNVNFQGVLDLVKNKQIDAGLSAISKTNARSKDMDFSNPYHRSVTVLVAPFASSIRKVEDLEGKVLGVEKGTTYEEYANSHLKKSREKLEIRALEKYSEIFELISNGKCDAILTGYSEASELQENMPDIKVIPIEGTEVEYCIALPKDSKLVGEINKHLDNMVTSGELRKLEEQFFKKVITE